MIYFQDYNNVLRDVQSFFKKTDNILDALAFVTWNDVINPQKRDGMIAKEFGIPTIVVEHGMKAVSDYQVGLKDISNGMGGRNFISDHICVWGERSKSIMMDAGVSESQITITGAPIAWEHHYIYKNGNESLDVGFLIGKKVVDPETGLTWELDGCRSVVPQKESDAKYIVFFPHHDFTGHAIEQNRRVFDQIKNIDTLFIKASDSYLNTEENNPFIEFTKIEDMTKRATKFMAIGQNHPKNIQFIQALLKKTLVAIATAPGTINGLCWAMNVPIITPKIDWHWRNDAGEPIYDIHPGDYTCEVEDLPAMIEGILQNDEKKESREKCAIEFMGLSAGNPIENLRAVIDEKKSKQSYNQKKKANQV